MTQVHTMVPVVVMFAAGLALCGQNPFSLKPSALARRAQMTPSQQARQILGPMASNDTVVGVADGSSEGLRNLQPQTTPEFKPVTSVLGRSQAFSNLCFSFSRYMRCAAASRACA